jgi:hypothetical protein
MAASVPGAAISGGRDAAKQDDEWHNTSMAEALQDPPRGISQIDDSTVNYVSPDTLPFGAPVNLCFNVTVDSPDLEYMDRFDVDLPDGWTVVWVYPVADTGCGSGSVEGVDPGNVLYWQTTGYPTTCGAWDNDVYDFCADVSLPDCSGAPWSPPWNIIGDGCGGLPHEVSGTTDPLYCLPGDLVLTPETLAVEGCHTLTQTHGLNLFNDTGSEGTFSLSYAVPSGNGQVSGPDNIYLGHGVGQDLIVKLAPDACLGDGTVVTVTVDAWGNGASDSSVIVKTIRDGPECPVCEPPTLALEPSYREEVMCAGETLSAALALDNSTGMDGSFDLTYNVTTGLGIASGPAELSVMAGAIGHFAVELQPDQCLVGGSRFTVIVAAEGNSASDTAVIVALIDDSPTCPDLCPWEYYYLPITVRDP